MIFLIFMFTVVPALELYLLIQAGEVIGAWETVWLVILTGVVGAHMARSQGLSIWLNTQKQMQTGQLPADNIIQGFLVFVGGLLLITPGFITDIIGLSFVFPVSRKFFIYFFKKVLAQKIQSGNFRVYTNASVNSDWSQARDVTSSVSEISSSQTIIDIKKE